MFDRLKPDRQEALDTDKTSSSRQRQQPTVDTLLLGFFFSSRRRHTRWTGDWSSYVCSSDLNVIGTTSVRSSPYRPNRTSSRTLISTYRSEERRVGKECRSRRSAYH